jgi:hypothetical protein
MKRTRDRESTGITDLLTVSVLMCSILTISASPAYGQGRSGTGKKSAERQTFAPRIVGRSESSIIEGLVVAAAPGAIRIKTAKGERVTLEVDYHTTVLDSGELVSISTMADIELAPSDLQIFDRVEVVFEREGARRLARIITRIQSERDRVAKR